MPMKIGGNKPTQVTAPTEKPATQQPATTKPAADTSKAWQPGAVTTPTAQAPAQTPPNHLDAELARLQTAIGGKNDGTDEKALFSVLEQNPPTFVASLAKQYEAKTGQTLRAALGQELSGAELRRGLKSLDASLVKPGDTTGTSGIAEKLLDLRKQGTVSESELVNTYRPTSNNKIDLLIQGANAYPEVMKAIDSAKDHVHVSYYIFSDDKTGNEFADKLIEAKKRGCDVRVQLDGVGSTLMNPWSGSNKILDKMEKAGIEIRKNHVIDTSRDSQILNHPDHRKIVVVDGKVGFTGGMNVADHYRDEYHDVMVRAEGDVVKQMQSEWMTGWMHLGGKVPGDDASFKSRYFPEIKPGDAPGKQTITTVQHIPGENRAILNTYLDKINTATKSIQIQNPYCTNPEIQNALIAAAKRGVKIDVILPGESDHGFSHLAAKQKYPDMMKAGIKIYEYPGFNHDKVMVTDDKFVTVGSSNLDDVALYHVYEMNLNVDDPKFAAETSKRLMEKDIPISKPMKVEDISQMQIMMGKFWNLFHHAI